MSVYEAFKHDFQSKNILIMGLGILGRGVGDAALFARIGANVRVTDLKTEKELETSIKKLEEYDISYTLSEHKREDVDWADCIIRNASVPWHHSLLDYAREKGRPIYMDTQLFLEYAKVFTIGITGTRGKTTTTTLIYEVLQQNLSGKQVLLGGNISGIATLEYLEKIKDPENTIAVLELSSWQLQAFHEQKISPDIAVLTNIYPDHLNSYASMEQYQKDKQAIYTYQDKDNHVFFNRDQEIFKQWAENAPSQVHFYSKASLLENIHLSLRGAHNLENAAAAQEVARLMGVNEEDIVHTFNNFRGVSSRLESIATIKGVEYINDTTSTTPVATIKALESFNKPVHLILGGFDKELPLDGLAQTVNQHAKSITLIKGSGTDRVKNDISPERITGEFDSLDKAVEVASNQAKEGEVVLLSPGFASFGMFVNEFDRGEQFNTLVKKLMQ